MVISPLFNPFFLFLYIQYLYNVMYMYICSTSSKSRRINIIIMLHFIGYLKTGLILMLCICIYVTIL